MSTLDRDPDDPAHAPVRAALAETGADLLPKPGWEAKVWDRIDGADAGGSGGTTRKNRRTVWLVGGGLLAAAAIVLVVWRAGGAGRGRDAAAVASIEIRRSAQVIRGTAAAPGDSALVRHPAAGGAVWIYLGEATLLVGCDATEVAPPACARGGAGVVVDLTLARPGTYHVLTSVGSRQPAPPTVDEALAALTRAGVAYRHDEIDVR